MNEWSHSFKAAFCKHYRCPPEAYRRKAFLKALYWRAWFLLPLLRLLPRRYFILDHTLIDEVGDARSWTDFNSAISNYVRSNMLRSGFLRRVGKLRVSCNRLKRMARKFFRERASAHSAAPKAAPAARS